MRPAAEGGDDAGDDEGGGDEEGRSGTFVENEPGQNAGGNELAERRNGDQLAAQHAHGVIEYGVPDDRGDDGQAQHDQPLA